MSIFYLVTSVLKIVALMAYLYGLLWVLGQKQLWVKIAGVIAAFGIVQLAITPIGGFRVFNDFDSGLLYQACTMAMVAMGLNLIYGFNGQFSLGQWGFYGVGAYTAADITYRWANGDARGLLVAGLGVAFGGLMILGVNKLVNRFKGMPVLSQFTLYLIGAVLAGGVAVVIGNAINPLLAPLLEDGGALAGYIPQQIVFFLAIVIAGIFVAELSFLIGLPVLTLGSDYFGIATLGLSIVIYTLMVNSDTILPFPEMKGGRGMIGVPKLTTWFWAFTFLLFVIIVMRNLIYSSTGRAIMAVREDETAAKAMGINVAQNKLLAFVVGSLFAGLGGAVYAHYIGFLSPGAFTFLLGFNPMIIVVFGGLGSMTGTLAASFGWIFFLEGLLRVLLGQLGTDAPTWRYVLYPIALLLLMLLKPSGLLGNVEWGFFKKPSFARVRTGAGATPASAGAAGEGGQL
jgi:branched-chain amino acid transport system permease protein